MKFKFLNLFLIILLFPIFLQSEGLELIRPNGGEVFYPDSSIVINWEGVSEKDTVSIEFSSDNGKNWEILTESATGNEFYWKAPKIESDSCLVRINLLWTPDDTVQYPIELTEFDFRVWDSDFSKNGNYLAVGSNRINIYEKSENWQLVHTIREYSQSIKFFNDDKHLAIGTAKGTVLIYNTKTWDEVNKIHASKPIVFCVLISPDNNYLIDGGWGLRVFDAKTWNIIKTFNTIRTHDIIFDVSRDYLIIGDNKQVKIINFDNMAEVKAFNFNQIITDIDLSINKKHLIISRADSSYLLLDYETLKISDNKNLKNYFGKTACFSPDSNHLYLTNNVNIFEIDINNWSFKRAFEAKGEISNLRISGDGRYLVSTNYDERATIYKLKDFNRIDISATNFSINTKKEPLYSFNFNISPNSASEKATIKLQLPEKMDIDLEMYNNLGKRVLNIFNGTLEEGFSEFDIDLRKLSSARYYIRLTTPTTTKTKFLEIVK